MCLDCGNVFKDAILNTKDYHCYSVPCPIASCSGYMFEIDEEMIIPISTLNAKGYITEFCCSGHINDDSYGGYIKFAEDCMPDTAPVGWNKEDWNIIRYHFKDKECAANRMKAMHRRIEALVKWCDELEEI